MVLIPQCISLSIQDDKSLENGKVVVEKGDFIKQYNLLWCQQGSSDLCTSKKAPKTRIRGKLVRYILAVSCGRTE